MWPSQPEVFHFYAFFSNCLSKQRRYDIFCVAIPVKLTKSHIWGVEMMFSSQCFTPQTCRGIKKDLNHLCPCTFCLSWVRRHLFMQRNRQQRERLALFSPPKVCVFVTILLSPSSTSFSSSSSFSFASSFSSSSLCCSLPLLQSVSLSPTPPCCVAQ